jgi:hypothetical protein
MMRPGSSEHVFETPMVRRAAIGAWLAGDTAHDVFADPQGLAHRRDLRNDRFGEDSHASGVSGRLRALP